MPFYERSGSQSVHETPFQRSYSSTLVLSSTGPSSFGKVRNVERIAQSYSVRVCITLRTLLKHLKSRLVIAMRFGE
jgi:hypothetical protein